MNKITVKHSSIHIANYEMGECTRLENIFSIWDKLTHTTHIKGLVYDEENKILMVPRGIDISYLENLFKEQAVVDTGHDSMGKIEDIMIKYKPRDDVQMDAISFMVGHDKFRGNARKSQLNINLNTGKGKSYCSIVATAILKLRSMVITSSVNWLKQWKGYILEYTDTKPQEIYMMVGSATIHRLLDTDISNYKYILASHSTIKSYATKFGWDKISELFEYCNIGIKIYDEAHLNFDNMIYIDAYTNTYKTYYVTATPARSDADENIIFKYYFKNVPSIDLFNDEEDPHTDYISMHYNSKPRVQDISLCANAYGFDKNKYSKYVVQQDNFYKLLHILIKLAINNGDKNIFYIATNDAIKIVYKWIIDNYPELSNDVGIYTSIITENKKEQLNKKIILSTTSSLGAAMDVKGLKMVVVLAEPFKSEVKARQSLGRTRDHFTYYIEIVDVGFQRIRRYHTSKMPIYKKYALSVSKIVLKDDELDRRVSAILNERNILYRPFFIESEHSTYECPFIITDKEDN